MKKITALLFSIIYFYSYGQFLSPGDGTANIYYSKGNVGIGRSDLYNSTLTIGGTNSSLQIINNAETNNDWGLKLYQSSNRSCVVAGAGADLTVTSGYSNKLILGSSQYSSGFVHVPGGSMKFGNLSSVKASIDATNGNASFIGKVGIGISNYSGNYKLILKQTSSDYGYGLRILNNTETSSMEFRVGTTGAVINAEGTTNLHLRTNHQDRIFIRNSDGFVGIGTTSPGSLLNVGTKTTSYPSSVAMFGAEAANSEANVLSLVNSAPRANDNAVSVAFHNSDVWSPTGKIIVKQAGDMVDLIKSNMILQTFSGGLKDRIIIQNDKSIIKTDYGYVEVGPRNEYFSHFETDRDRFYFNKPVYVNSGIVGSFINDLSFQTSESGTLGSFITRMTISNETGNVGIGAAEPSEKLEVAGKVKATSFITNTGFNVVTHVDEDENVYLGTTDGSINTGEFNSFIGYLAGSRNTSGRSNTFLGRAAGYLNETGEYNVYIGRSVGYYNKEGNQNTLVGTLSGANTLSSQNTFIGCSAGYTNTTGEHNVYIGCQSGKTNNGRDNVFIGTNSGYNLTNASNKLIIANNSTTNLITGDFVSGNVGIGTDPSVSLDINGTDAIRIPAGTTEEKDQFTAEAGMLRYNTSDDQLEFYNDGNNEWEYLRSNSNSLWVENTTGINNVYGNVGIGTNTPSADLEIEDVVPVLKLTSTERYNNESLPKFKSKFSSNEDYLMLNINEDNSDLDKWQIEYNSKVLNSGISYSATKSGELYPKEYMKLDRDGNLSLYEGGLMLGKYFDPFEEVDGGAPKIRFDNTYDGTDEASANKIVFFGDNGGEYGIGISASDFDMFSFRNYRFYTQHTPTNEGLNAMTIFNGGAVGIGVTDETDIPSSYLLGVNGGIAATRVTVKTGPEWRWSDFVFDEEYELKPLEEVEKFVAKNKHLPDVPSEAEVTKDGIDLGRMDAVLLQKVEELTLYMIEMSKQNKEQAEMIESLQAEIKAMKKEK